MTDQQKRTAILQALQAETPRTRVAREAGISRSYLYALVDEVTADPLGAVERARNELAFRLEVLEVLEGSDAPAVRAAHEDVKAEIYDVEVA